MKSLRQPIHLTFASFVAILCAMSLEASAQTDASSPSLANQHVVKPIDLILRVEREGRIESADKTKVRLIPQEYKGAFEVTEVLRRSGRVKKGDVLLRLEGEALNNEIIAAQMAFDHAKKRLQIAVDEKRILAEANDMKRQQVQKNRENAEKELVIWEKYESPGMLKGAELNLKQREFGLADQKQELDQLESMYSGTHLATETKDIVLERARRGVMMSEAWLTLSVNSELVTREFRHAIQDRNVRDGLRMAQQEEAHTHVNLAAAEERKSMELEAATQALADAEKRLARLQQDKALLTVVAPADGVMTRIELEPRDTLAQRQTICEILNTSKLRVKYALTAEDLRALQSNVSLSPSPSTFTMQLPEYPEIIISGTIEELSEIGAPVDNSTHFPLSVSLNESNPIVRLGMRCKLFAELTLSNVLTVPSTAVKWENGKAWCLVQTNEGAVKRTVRVGASSGDSTVVAEGLSAGDAVVLGEANVK